MTIQVEPWDARHADRIAAAFGPPEHWTAAQGRQGWRSRTDGEFWSRCLIVWDGAEPIAVAAAFHPRLHTAREWASVEVSPGRRREGWGTRALAEIRAAIPTTAGPLRAKVTADSPAAAMAESMGMRPIQRTREVRVRIPADLPGATAFETPAGSAPAIRAWRDWYVTGHHWDRPSPQPDEFWTDTFGTAEFALATSGPDGLTGIAHLYRDDDRQWFSGGALDRDDATAGDVAAGLLRSAREHGGEVVNVELDDWMTDVAAVIDRLDHTVLDEAFIVADPSQRGSGPAALL